MLLTCRAWLSYPRALTLYSSRLLLCLSILQSASHSQMLKSNVSHHGRQYPARVNRAWRLRRSLLATVLDHGPRADE
jgi:hypothetical protein